MVELVFRLTLSIVLMGVPARMIERRLDRRR